MAKQAVVGTDAMLQYQYDQHGALAKLQIPKVRVPKALALLRAKHDADSAQVSSRAIPLANRLNTASAEYGEAVATQMWSSQQRLPRVEANRVAVFSPFKCRPNVFLNTSTRHSYNQCCRRRERKRVSPVSSCFAPKWV